jgi:hypothetical protein
MTRDEILNMPAGREMDALVAEKVMGWRLHPHKTHWMTNNNNFRRIGTFLPSDDISAAWEVVEKMKEKGRLYLIVSDDIGYKAEILLNDPVPMATAQCDTAPLAICRAALLAVMEE